MTNFFADTSALAKRYVVETGTNWVKSWIQPAAGNVVFVSELTIVEMSSLLARKHGKGYYRQVIFFVYATPSCGTSRLNIL